MTKITKDQVKKVAELSKLNLSEEELKDFSKGFTETIDYVNTLDELDTKNVKPTFQVTGLENVYMESDENRATLTQEEALKNASDEVNKLFGTSAVFDR